MSRTTTCFLAWVTVVVISTITPTEAQNSTSNDPCNNYTALDNPWRGTNTTADLGICDQLFNWTGWYRMLYFGMNIRMPESCVNEYRCGTYTTLWLSGSHPQIAAGQVSRSVCGRTGTNCCASTFTIQVKACPGNYYVYKFIKTTCTSVYCADVNTISPNIDPTTLPITSTSTDNVDPCSVYEVLDHDWRVIYSLSYTIYRGHDDTVATWDGWYRLYLQGESAQIPEPDWCASYLLCGGYTPLLLGGSHPLPEDGIVTRDIYGSYGYVVDSRRCNSLRSNPIQVKACPGNYYVYRLVQPTVAFPRPTYCAVVLDTPSNDPCNNYTPLDQPWRGTNATAGTNCDLSFNGNGWYRLLYRGMNIRMPGRCIASSKCGTETSLWLNGSHPQVADGIVVLRVCGNSGSDCCYYRSTPVRVKACPGNYYVYEFFSTTFCNAAYCADVTTIAPISTTTVPSSTERATSTTQYMTNVTTIAPISTSTVVSSTELTTSTTLYMTNETTIAPISSTTVVSSIEPTTSTTLYMTNMTTTESSSTTIVASSTELTTSTTLYMTNVTTIAPISTTTVVSSTEPTTSTTLYMTNVTTIAPISTTTVVSSTKPTTSTTLYMTSMTTTTPISKTTVASSTKPTTSTTLHITTLPDLNITVSAECQDFTVTCADMFFSQMKNISYQVLPPEVVTKNLDMVLNTQEQLLKVETLGSDQLAYYGNTVVNRTEGLVSTLVKPTETYYSLNISCNGLEVQVFAVGPKASLKEILLLRINNDAQMAIDLFQISLNNNGSAAVAFMSFTNMSDMLKPTFFKTTTDTVKTMMSNVMLATLPKTNNTQLTKPVNFTVKHTAEIDPNGILFCVYWKDTEWVVDGCERLWTNISHSMCSCTHLSTFALIMQVNPASDDDSDPLLDLFNTLAVAVGLVFLSLALLTFALCRHKLRVNMAPLINLCFSLFLAQLLFLLVQKFLQYIRADQLVCAVLAGVLHFFFLSAFVWMFIEAVLLFISVKNISKIRSKQKEVLNWKYLLVIGYVIPLTVVGVSVGLFPDGYGSDQCWIRTDRDFVWSFLGPVCFILTFNLILFFIIIITLRTTLAGLNIEQSQIKKNKVLVFKTLIQIVILGGPWFLGFFTQGSKVLEIVFLFLNSQQGTFIFLVHCVFNQEVRQQYRNWLTAFCPHCKTLHTYTVTKAG